MKHPNCEHQCSGNCRRVGCNCACGEFHDTLTQSELDEIQEDTTSMEEKLESIDKLAEKCAYCGEYKWDNTEKHIGELAKFLQGKIQECLDVIKPLAK